MDQQRAPIIGIVGGVGSGKSAVARWMAEHFDGHLINADLVGHEVLLRDDVKAALHRTFGDAIFVDGEIDRQHLGARVFGDDPQHQASRRILERIVHPVMGELICSRITSARQDNSVRLIVFDAAILLESGWREHCDVVAFIDAPRELRLRRVAGARGWSDDELSRREASQWPLAQKREACDVVIDNSGTIEQAGQQLAQFLINQGWLEPGNHVVTGSLRDTNTLAHS